MNKSTKKLRLGPLSKTASVGLTLPGPAILKAALDRYAALQAYQLCHTPNYTSKDTWQ